MEEKGLRYRLKPTYELGMYPVMQQCVYCNRDYAPISYLPHGDKYTICCHHVIDKQIEVIGYVNLIDLEDTDWDTEL